VSNLDLDRYVRRIEHRDPLRIYGRVEDVVGLTIVASGPPMSLGDLCYLKTNNGHERCPVEVVGFRGGKVLLMPLGPTTGIGPGNVVVPTHRPRYINAGYDLLGRVVGSLGQPIDNGPAMTGLDRVPLIAEPPQPLHRARIREPLPTGVRAIDACVTAGKGQRLAVMSGSGVGKSKLIGMIARNSSASVNVIGLIGERGREVREFIESDLGPEGLARSVVVVATSDEPALLRLSGAYTATAVAEWFRAQGHDVMLIMDSITRFAMAQREVGLAVGEPPTTKGYPPSVYALLPKLLERAGNSSHGSITGFYAVLVEGDDMQDPIGDAVRSIVDGHVALSRDLSSRGHYPPIDVLESISRSMTDVATEDHLNLAIDFRRILATYREAEDLINIGAYVAGSNPEIDRAIRVMPRVRSFLQQGLREDISFDELPALMNRALRAG
jgi:flagellum-specific ATP synthase